MVKSRVDVDEVMTRDLKYFIEGLLVAVAAYLIPGRSAGLKLEEVAMLGLTASAVFAVLDMFAPSVVGAARQGAGFGIGASLVQWPGAVGGLRGLA